MFELFHKSLRNKLLLAFIGIGFLPYLLFLTYTLVLSETKIVSKLIQDQYSYADNIKNLISGHLQSLAKEVNFLSQLDVMDDILAEDIDKRISRLLRQKADDLDLQLTFLVVNEKKLIIADSNKKNKIINSANLDFKEKKGFYIIFDQLYIYKQIYASFDKKKSLGYIVLKYKLSNLSSYLSHIEGIHTYIINTVNDLIIGSKVPLKISIVKDNANLINDDHLIVYKKMQGMLKGWYIVYAADKEIALAFLYDFIRFMLYMSPLLFFAIIYVAIRYSSYIVRPVQDLTFATNDIIKTGDYSIQIDISTRDEIARLTHSFNNMLSTTDLALKQLEKENRIRLQRFIHLIQLLNTIIETKTEQQCIETSLQQIRDLVKNKDIHFTTNKPSTHSHIDLYVTDFDKNQKVYFGSIVLIQSSFDDKNEKQFYQSIATMIMLQLERIRLIDKTLSASNAKSAFISNMSHELRTPLNAIIGFSQYMISYEELTEDQIDTVANIESSAQYLLSMINEILDIAKIEAGKMEAHIETVNILSLAREAHTMLQPLALGKNIQFDIISDHFDDLSYDSDPKIFKQILVNLLSNAIKFTEKGLVTLELSSSDHQLMIKITDTGIGINEQDLDSLFADFTQVENVMQKKHKGTGLGLSLSKKLARLLGGDVWLESNGEGHGTISYFTIKFN